MSKKVSLSLCVWQGMSRYGREVPALGIIAVGISYRVVCCRNRVDRLGVLRGCIVKYIMVEVVVVPHCFSHHRDAEPRGYWWKPYIKKSTFVSKMCRGGNEIQ